MNISGVWSVRVSLLDTENKSESFTLLSVKFLVLPLVNQKEEFNLNAAKFAELKRDIRKFWIHESICVNSCENLLLNETVLLGELFKPCVHVHWSSFYPDPKSDIFENLSIDRTTRIIE
jgi:hypothetical protein